MTSEARIAEALAVHNRHDRWNGSFHDAACWGCTWGTAGVYSMDERDELFAAHQAEIIAALPEIAVVELPKPTQSFHGELTLWEIEAGCKVAYLGDEKPESRVSIPQRWCGPETAVRIAGSILAAARAAERDS